MAPDTEERVAAALRTGARTLDLSWIGLTAVPESVRSLTGLTRLYLDGNRLAAVPEWIGELTGLVDLGLKGNSLTALPESIGNLTGLVYLRLDGNRLASVPQSIGNLTRLERLCLEGNPLVDLPETLGRLSRLAHFSLGMHGSTTPSASLNQAMARLPPGQRLLGHIGASGSLRDLTLRTFEHPPTRILAQFLGGPFPPQAVVPAIPRHFLPTVRALALGRPGDRVQYGHFPSRETKLARLALAHSREYPAAVVLHAAERAYDGAPDGPSRTYAAHDALACALVHPDIDATSLVERYTAQGRGDRGRRSRRKTHQVLRWARQYGYLPGEIPCPCGHKRFTAPTTRQQALALAGNWTTVRDLLSVVHRDPDRWLALLRCTRCQGLWAEDSMASGHATLLFGYPVERDDDRGGHTVITPLTLQD